VRILQHTRTLDKLLAYEQQSNWSDFVHNDEDGGSGYWETNRILNNWKRHKFLNITFSFGVGVGEDLLGNQWGVLQYLTKTNSHYNILSGGGGVIITKYYLCL